MKKLILKTSFLAMALGLTLMLFGCNNNGTTIEKFTVTFMSYDHELFDSVQVYSGSTVARPVTDPAHEILTFTNWYGQETGGEVFDFGAPIIADTIIWARFAETKIVVFDLQGGSWDRPNSQQVALGSPVARPPDPSMDRPTIEGLFNAPAGGNWLTSFEGWYFEGTLWDFDDTVEDDMTLIARWSTSVTPIDIGAGNIVTAAFNYVLANPGDYYLLLDQDVEATANFSLVGNSSLTLIGLNELRTISRPLAPGAFLTLGQGFELILGKNIAVTGQPNQPTRVFSGSLIHVQDNGTLVMNHGSRVSGNRLSQATDRNGSGVFVTEGGIFTMNGGEISGNTAAGNNCGGGVRIGDSGIFTMNDGKISGNTTSSQHSGAGVSISNGTFTMNGGRISGNTSNATTAPANFGGWNGGGVHVIGPRGVFNMNDGEIYGNTMSMVEAGHTGAGGVFIEINATFNMNGGRIFNNTAGGASSGGGVAMSIGTFNMDGGEISGNSASGTNSAGGLRTFNARDWVRISNGIIHGRNAAAGLRNTAAGSNNAAAMRIFILGGGDFTFGGAQHGTWNNDEFAPQGDFAIGAHQDTIHVVNGVLQQN